jgi:hypothetical protein
MAITYTTTTVANPSGAQGSYPQRLVVGHEGMIADLQAFVSRSYTNESGAVVPFGHAVIIDSAATSGLGVKLPAGAAATGVLGLAVDSNTFEANANSSYQGTGVIPGTSKTADGRIGYPDKQIVNVLSKGVVYVYTVDAVALGDAVRLYHTDHASASSNGGYKGRFGKTAVAGKTFEVTAGARWVGAAAAGGIALLEIDIPTLTVSADT